MNKTIVFVVLLISVFSIATTIHVKADYAVPTENRVEYTGNVHAVMEGEGIELWSDSLTIEKVNDDWNLIKASGNVRVTMENMNATSTELEYRLDKKIGTMKGSVEIYIVDDEVYIKADEVNFDREKEIYRGGSRDFVQIEKEDLKLKSRKFVYDRKASTMNLTGDFEAVQIKEGEDGKKEEVKLKGQSADLNTEKNEMKVIGDVSIEYGKTKASCEELDYDMKSRGKLVGNVVTVIKPEKEDTEEIEVHSDVLEFDTEKDWYSGYSEGKKVEIKKGKTTIYSEKFEFYRKEGKVFLTGGVEIRDPERNVKIKADKAVVYTEEEKMELWNVKMDIER